MDNLKSETKGRSGECAVIRYIFRVMYEKEYYVTKENHGEWAIICFIFRERYGSKELDVMDNESI
jgi:hypothetical protein